MNYTEISPEFALRFFELVGKSKRVVITGHRSPDEDAIASSLAVYEVVSQKFPSLEVQIIISAEPLSNYKVFKNFDKINFVTDIADHVTSDDTLIVLDGSQFYRYTAQPEELAKVKTTICIDHHASPIDKFDLSLVAPHYPACTEIIYRAFYDQQKPEAKIAEVFLMGILGDTGNLAYLKPHQTSTLQITKELLDISKVEIQEFLSRYQAIAVPQFELLKEFIKNTTYGKANGWPEYQYSFLNEDFVKQGGFSDNDVSAASGFYADQYLRKIEGHGWGFTVKPKADGTITISARSLPGNVNVRDLMERTGLGGGHNRAAGGTSKDATVDQTVKTITNWLNNNKPVLD